MTYACVQDIASSWEQYERITAAIVEPTPSGLILHLAGPTDEGFRIIDVWDNEGAWQRFRAERLAPAIAALGGPARPAPRFRDLHPAHVVVGHRGAIDTGGSTRQERPTVAKQDGLRHVTRRGEVL